MRCALVGLNDNIVVNLIIANPETDNAPEGHIIIGLPDDSLVAIGWSYNPVIGEFTPPSE